VSLLARLADIVPQRVKTLVVGVSPHRVKEAVPLVMSIVRREGSTFVTSYLGNLKGVEIGAASYRRFFLNVINVDRAPDVVAGYKRIERGRVGRAAKVDIVVSSADVLPFDDDSYDFVFSSHVIEHFPDPIKALHEWVRVARRYVVLIAPHHDRTFDSDRPLTSITELLERNRTGFTSEEERHWSVWTCESFLEMCSATGLRVIDHQDPDDRTGDGFTVVIDASTERDAVVQDA
jgi:SAM-dependent methyltransferase